VIIIPIMIAQTITHDKDGNLTHDGDLEYVYDAENRLIRIVRGDHRVMMKYDYMGRRVEVMLEENDEEWETVWTRRYVYDGWHLIAEIDADTGGLPVTSTYFWGYDVSNSIGGAGGIGGLLLIDHNGDRYLPGYDTQGNIALLIKESNGTLAAQFEYDPYGRIIRMEGDYEKTPFRWQSKWDLDYMVAADTGTSWGLVDYGLRWYQPRYGRFINRDPIGEAGGLNLYEAFGGDPVNNWDYLGMFSLGDILNPFSRKNPLNPFSKKNLRAAAMLPHYNNLLYWTAPKFYRQTAPQVNGIVVTAIVSYFAGPVAGGAAGGFVSGFESSLLNGGSMSHSMRSGAIGAGIGGVSGYVGAIGNTYVRVAANAALSGAISEARGGEFRHGVYSSLATSFASPYIGRAASQNWYAGLVMSAAIGGSTARISGGSFRTGAFTAAFQHIVSNVPTSDQLSASNVASGVGIAARETARMSLDLAGKAWSSPNTAIGLVWGLAGAPFGTRISIDNNAIQFENHPFMMKSGAITLGNTISYGSGVGPEKQLGRGILTTFGTHELQHTYQGQFLGPLYLPIHMIAIGVSVFTSGNTHHNNFMEGEIPWPGW
jgi:RHS repeat-associated protein